MASNTLISYVAYRDNNAWTSERGASKITDNLIQSSSHGLGDEGCVINGLYVQPSSPADTTITIAAGEPGGSNPDGHCIIRYDDYCYIAWLDNDYVMEIGGASQSLNRISYIVAYIDRDVEYNEEDKIIESPDVFKFAEVQGTEGSSPAAPTRTQIRNAIGINNPYIILAKIQINANTSAITTSMITDMRQKAGINKDIDLHVDELYALGVLQANTAKTPTRIVITGPNANTPAAVEDAELIWIRKKA